ncbi:SDR family NAD(P)-dependent oxidoreductase [Novosphingobium pentaromativorans]|uniref:SDR family NAD(P)-dependent oxidoreductase n=1 Tax=Novosphingobium pentaromativorans TaxID=205844 RepID=UPI00051F855D|nr:SDR family oxidoreductase [Novosphingobium pentaromativorans]AIT82101.1 hypothetical protein JI59_21435 [Novosphingobium pentaromativorans US6-1]
MNTPVWRTPLQFDRIVVTGGGSGIGRATALELANCGATVYIMGRRPDALAATASLGEGLSGRIVPIPCDLLEIDATDAAFGAVEADGGPAFGLVHCAAATTYCVASEISHAAFDQTIRTTLYTGFNATKRWAEPILAAAQKTGEAQPASAVMLSSAVAARGGPGIAHSSAGKAGLESFARACAREWGPSGIRINIVGPGAFPVEKSEKLWSDPDMYELASSATALGRLGNLPEIVAPIVFFLTSGSGFTTGQTIISDGGFGLVPWGIRPDGLKRGLNNKFDDKES